MRSTPRDLMKFMRSVSLCQPDSGGDDQRLDGLHETVARLGLERILRRIFQLLSWAFSRSPAPRWRAWAVLTCF
jgi:hypothetical protein